MSKETLMRLADDYYQNPYREGTDNSLTYIKTARQALSDAIDAALKQARVDALEEAAIRVAVWDKSFNTGGTFADAIRTMKEKPNV